MGRTRRQGRGSIVDSLLILPWWFSVILAAIALPGLHFVGSLMIARGGSLSSIGRISQFLAIPAAIGLLLVAGGAALHARRKRRDAERALTPEGRAQLSSKEFEFAVYELLKSRGYYTEENLSCGADGGVDVRAWRDSKLFLVQCRQWKNRPVGAPAVRDLLGCIAIERAAGALLVCSGSFTREACEVSRGQPIELIDGSQLASFAAPFVPERREERIAAPPAPVSAESPPCPKCGGTMVMRTARRGASAGGSFWGCRSYPSCRGTRARV